MRKHIYVIFLRKMADLIESGAIDFPSDLFKEAVASGAIDFPSDLFKDAVASGAIEITDYRKGAAE